VSAPEEDSDVEDARARIAELTRAASESSAEGLAAESADYLCRAIRVAEEAGLDIEVESLRENLLYGYLVGSNIAAALAEVESWSSWPTDDIGLWLLVEAFFQSRRRECVPILERMLRDANLRDELSIRRMKEMIGVAATWD
jgi:hypothetical protein